MEDRDWQILQELHRTKNITKAAQLLYMSQPALTARLSRTAGFVAGGQAGRRSAAVNR